MFLGPLNDEFTKIANILRNPQMTDMVDRLEEVAEIQRKYLLMEEERFIQKMIGVYINSWFLAVADYIKTKM